MILYGSTYSPFVRKIVAFAAEAGIEIENIPTRLSDADPDFLACSPLKKMPALRDGDFTLADSSAIAHYIDTKHDAGLIPADAQGRARAVWWDEVADTVLFSAIAPIFFNRVVAPLFLGREGDEQAALTAERTTLPPLLDWLESEMPEAGSFLLGDRLSLADIAIAAPFANLDLAGGTLEAHPRLAAYVATMFDRPSFASIIRDRANVERIRTAKDG